MRIGHCGTGGTGKTTLAKELAKVLDLEFKPSVVREVFAEFGWTERMQREASAADCWRLQEEIFKRKFLQDKHFGKDVVFDRTPVDHLAYSIFRCEGVFEEDSLKGWEVRTQEEMRRYDVVIYHPILARKVVDDGMRENNYVYRVIIDNLILGYLHKFEVEYLVVPDGEVMLQRDSLYHFIESIRWLETSLGESPPVREGAPQPEVVRARLSSQDRVTAESANSVNPDQSELEANNDSGCTQ